MYPPFKSLIFAIYNCQDSHFPACFSVRVMDRRIIFIFKQPALADIVYRQLKTDGYIKRSLDLLPELNGLTKSDVYNIHNLIEYTFSGTIFHQNENR